MIMSAAGCRTRVVITGHYCGRRRTQPAVRIIAEPANLAGEREQRMPDADQRELAPVVVVAAVLPCVLELVEGSASAGSSWWSFWSLVDDLVQVRNLSESHLSHP